MRSRLNLLLFFLKVENVVKLCPSFYTSALLTWSELRKVHALFLTTNIGSTKSSHVNAATAFQKRVRCPSCPFLPKLDQYKYSSYPFICNTPRASNLKAMTAPRHSSQPATHEQPHKRPGFANNDKNTLLVVATLITTLTYQIGTNIPGGYYQDDNGHIAGDPIMRDKHRLRYWLFMTGAWGGFASSMLVTLALLLHVPAKSWIVRGSFAAAYSSLVLTFITSQAKTSLGMDLLLWVVVMLFLLAAISFDRIRRRVNDNEEDLEN